MPVLSAYTDEDGNEIKADENIRWQYGSEENSRFYIVDTHTAKDFGAEVGFKDGKHELFPFPYTVTSINPNITQNPGWAK